MSEFLVTEKSYAENHDRDAVKLRMAEHVANIDKEYPEAGIKAKGDWWAPSIVFGFDIKRMVDQKYKPEVVETSLDEARGYLAGHEDLIEQFDKIFGNRAVWDIMYKNELEKQNKLEREQEEAKWPGNRGWKAGGVYNPEPYE